MAEKSEQSGVKTIEIELEKLYLDPNNYRLIHEAEYVKVPDEKIREKDVARRTYRLIAGTKNQNIQDLVESFKSNGYLPVGQIQVKALGNSDDYVVIEGNRRVATLMHLKNEYEQKSIDLGELARKIFLNVPVVLYEKSENTHYLTLMALKHISGNRKWGEWNQAVLLDNLLKDLSGSDDSPEENICKRIGISKTELRRSIRALAMAREYQKSDYGDQFRGGMFPIFREAVRNQALKEWLRVG